MKDLISKMRENKKTIIVSAVVVLIVVIVSLLIFKDFELVSDGKISKDPLPLTAACDNMVIIREDVIYNQSRTKKDIKDFIDSVAAGCLDKEQFWSIQGFLTEIYIKNPGKVEKWLRKKNFKSIKQIQALIIPLNSPQNRKKYEKYIKKYVKNGALYSRYMGYNPIEIDKFYITEPGYIQYIWGRYLGSGDTKFIDKVARCTQAEYPEDCYMNPEVQDMAKATLRQFSQKYPEVKKYLTDNLTSYRTQTQKVLRLEVLGMKDNDPGIEESAREYEVLNTTEKPKKKKWFNLF